VESGPMGKAAGSLPVGAAEAWAVADLQIFSKC